MTGKPWILIRSTSLGRKETIDVYDLNLSAGQIVQIKVRNFRNADATENPLYIDFYGDVHSEGYYELFTKSELDHPPGAIRSYTLVYPQNRLHLFNSYPTTSGSPPILKAYIYYRILK